MIAEDLTSEQIIEKNIKRINIYRDWYYKGYYSNHIQRIQKLSAVLVVYIPFQMKPLTF